MEVVARHRANDTDPLFVTAHPLWVLYAQFLDTNRFPSGRVTLHMSPSECLALYRALVIEADADEVEWQRKVAKLAPGNVLAPKTVGTPLERARSLVCLHTTQVLTYRDALLDLISELAVDAPALLLRVVERLGKPVVEAMSVAREGSRLPSPEDVEWLEVDDEFEDDGDDDDNYVDADELVDAEELLNEDDDDDLEVEEEPVVKPADGKDDEKEVEIPSDDEEDDADLDAMLSDDDDEQSKLTASEAASARVRRGEQEWFGILNELRANDRLPTLAFSLSRKGCKVLVKLALQVIFVVL